MALAALSATLTLYLKEQALEQVPVWRMISRPLAAINEDAENWAAYLKQQGIEAETMAGESTVGGGSLPGTSMPTQLVAITHPDVEGLAARLRGNELPVIGRVQNGRFLIDPRTILPTQVDALLEALVQHSRL